MPIKSIKALLALIFSAFALLGASTANSAYLIDFDRLSYNAPVDYSDQFSVLLEDVGGSAKFTVNNASTLPSSITGVYFEYGDINVNGMFVSDSDADGVTTDAVEFLFPGSPDHLPGGNAYFDNPADFSGHTNGISNGIDNSDEYITFLALLGSSFSDLTAAIGAGTFRIGLHVQGILPDQNDWSDAYVSTVPVPAAAWLFGSALIGFFAMSKRRNKTQ